MRWIKLALPSLAALLIGLLIVLPGLQTDDDRFELDVTRPKKGELEKLHMENTVFYITDADNQVNNFNADKIDETEPGSKLIKLINPAGASSPATDRTGLILRPLSAILTKTPISSSFWKMSSSFTVRE